MFFSGSYYWLSDSSREAAVCLISFQSYTATEAIFRRRSNLGRVLCQVSLEHLTSNLPNIVSRFSDHATQLGVSATDLYNALLADAEDQPSNWNLQGRQADVWKEKGTRLRRCPLLRANISYRLHPVRYRPNAEEILELTPLH